jgi:hypothetical protein
MTVSFTTMMPAWTGAQGERMKLTKTIIMFVAALAINTAFAASARAQCGISSRDNLNALNLLNGSATAMPSTSARPATQESDARNGEEPTIVGLWDTKLMSNNQLFDEGFDQFHSDSQTASRSIDSRANQSPDRQTAMKTTSQGWGREAMLCGAKLRLAEVPFHGRAVVKFPAGDACVSVPLRAQRHTSIQTAEGPHVA